MFTNPFFSEVESIKIRKLRIRKEVTRWGYDAADRVVTKGYWVVEYKESPTLWRFWRALVWKEHSSWASEKDAREEAGDLYRQGRIRVVATAVKVPR